MENHHQGISPQTWFSNGLLTDFFRVLTTTQDKNGKVGSFTNYHYQQRKLQCHPCFVTATLLL
jgi:hypothetical protein